MAPHFKRAGVPVFKTSGIPGHNNLCCCHEDPALPCPNCNTGQTPNALEITISSGDLADFTCVDCGRLDGTYILQKTNEIGCFYTYCEPDPCQATSAPYGTEPCNMRLWAEIQSAGNVLVRLEFCNTFADCTGNSTAGGLGDAQWSGDTWAGAANPWDCLTELNDDVAADSSSALPDIEICMANAAIHVRALN